MIFGCLVHTKIWGIFHTHNLDSTRQLKGDALNLSQVHLLRNSVQLTIATLLSTMCWEFSTSQSSRCEREPMFPLFSDPLPICVFFTLGICVLFFACLFLNLFFIEVHWFITLYKFHVYIIFLLLYTLQHAHHQKVSFHVSPYSRSALPITPSPPAPSPLVTTTLYSVSTCLLLLGLFTYFVYLFVCFLYSTYEWHHMVIVFPHLAYFT